MKGLKKVLALCLVVVLMMAMVPAGYAEDAGLSITIKNAVPDATYKLYRLFDVVSTGIDENGKALISYQVVDEWASFFQSGDGKNYITLDAKGQPTAKGSGDAFAKELAQKIQAYLESTSATVTSQMATSDVVTFENISGGYYFLSSTAGTNCILGTVYSGMEGNGLIVNEKNSVIPKSDKKIKEGEGLYEENYAGIGDTVTFVATVTLGNKATGYVYHDKMSAGLTYTAVTSVTVDGKEVDAKKYTVAPSASDNCTFEIEFNDDYIATLSSGKEIIVTYTAKVNEKAFPNGVNETNEGWVVSDEGETTHITTTTTHIEFSLVKTDDSASKKPLEGAVFNVLDSKKAVMEFVQEGGKYRPASTNDGENKVTGLTTPTDGVIQFFGLTEGTYYLHEKTAPRGYNVLNEDVEVKIIKSRDTDGKPTYSVSFDGTANGERKVNVENKAGATLPSTGGIGTTVFYIVGGILMAAAAVVLITKKRMEKNV